MIKCRFVHRWQQLLTNRKSELVTSILDVLSCFQMIFILLTSRDLQLSRWGIFQQKTQNGIWPARDPTSKWRHLAFNSLIRAVNHSLSLILSEFYQYYRQSLRWWLSISVRECKKGVSLALNKTPVTPFCLNSRLKWTSRLQFDRTICLVVL